jgi:hypothetical protein
MFEQLLPNKNKIATVWRDIYYTKFTPKLWYLRGVGFSTPTLCRYNLSTFIMPRDVERQSDETTTDY